MRSGSGRSLEQTSIRLRQTRPPARHVRGRVAGWGLLEQTERRAADQRDHLRHRAQGVNPLPSQCISAAFPNVFPLTSQRLLSMPSPLRSRGKPTAFTNVFPLNSQCFLSMPSPISLHSCFLKRVLRALLCSAGYATAAMGKWHVGTKPQYMPTGAPLPFLALPLPFHCLSLRLCCIFTAVPGMFTVFLSLPLRCIFTAVLDCSLCFHCL